MADRKYGHSQDTQNSVQSGLYQDIDYASQPDNTYPYALNAINCTLFGHQGYLSTELGNRLVQSVPGNYIPIGAVNMLDDEILVFSAQLGGLSEIGIFNTKDNSYTTILNDTTCFNFSINYQIQGVFRLRKGCNRTVYWTDFYNVVRVIDIDDVIANPTNYQTVSGAWNCDAFALSLPRNLYCIEAVNVSDSGGALRVGTYQVVFRYLDSDFNPTPWMDISNPVPIIDEPYSAAFDTLDGFPAIVTNVTSMITSKSLSISVSNIDTDFRYIQMAVLEFTSATSNTPRVVIKPYTNILNSSMTFVYGGFNENSDEITVVSEIIVPPIAWDVCKTITQLDGSLILGNLKSKEIDFAEFQKAANLIQTTYRTEAHYYYSTSSKHPAYYDKYRSLMRDEIYALGIVWVFNDGTETPVFHIPGRTKDLMSTGTAMPIVDVNVFGGLHNREDFLGGWDSAVANAAGNPFDTKDTAITGETAPERWKVYNTAYRIVPVPGGTGGAYNLNNNPMTSGELGYWESDVSYPDDLDCDGKPVYPYTETSPGVYVMHKIRHHRMPDTTLEPHFFEAVAAPQNPFGDFNPKVIPLGLHFANIAPPALYVGKLQGYKIVISDREGNKTVIDKGIIYKNYYIPEDTDTVYEADFEGGLGGGGITITDGYYQQSFPYNKQRISLLAAQIPDLTSHNIPFVTPEDTNLNPDNSSPARSLDPGVETSFSFHSPLTKFKRPALSVDHIKIEREYKGSVAEWTRIRSNLSDDWSTRCDYNETFVPAPTATDRRVNRKISAKAYVDPNTFLPGGILSAPFLNVTQQETLVLETVSSLVDPTSVNDDTSDAGDEGGIATFTSGCYYAAIKVYNRNLYGNIDNVKYIQGSRCIIGATTTTCDIFPGDVFIGKIAFRKTFYSYPIQKAGEDYRLIDNHLPYYFCECELNHELRHEGDTNIPYASDCSVGIGESYFPKYSGNFIDFLNATYCHINYYAYNDNYSQLNTARTYFPLIQGFDYCSNCLESYKNRIAYSVKSAQEDRFDNYRLFLTNNYKDIPQSSGEIWNLFTKRNDLYIQTTESLWVQKLSQMELQTSNQQSVQVGTGADYSLPTLELVTTPTGYTGCQSQWATMNTEAGVFYVNQKGGKVFLFGEKLEEISLSGMRTFFRTALPSSYINDFYNLLGFIPATMDNPANPYSGVGCLSVYDERNKRFILTKRDFKFTSAFTAAFRGIFDPTFSYNVGDIYYTIDQPAYNIPEAFYITTVAGLGGLIPATAVALTTANQTYFENKSFTVSYSLINKSWTSFHSYLPTFYFSSRDLFYSTPHSFSEGIFEHGRAAFAVYYTEYEPFIVEVVAKTNPLETQIFENFSYISDALAPDFVTSTLRDEQLITFNKAWFYTARQCSGEIDLVVKPTNDPFYSLTYSNVISPVERLERTWRINRFRDLITQTAPEQGMFSSNWNDVLYRGRYPIDKVPNLNVYNINKSQFEASRMRDKYMVVRLINDEDISRNYLQIFKFTNADFETSNR